ncbi:hypothetical protein [Arthrobacter sp. B1805]|uniref:DUF6993 domain-containing protein n=1 Tax=Arthrobacter sp. B1805 TaxID=2058892 RepID=UPI0011B09AAF|nr:hypothetical protein [Arthrobacter sp. B1805]
MTSAALPEQNPRRLSLERVLAVLVTGALLALTSCTATPGPAPLSTAGSGASSVATPPVEGAGGSESTAAADETPSDAARIAAAVEGALRTLASAQASVTSAEVRTAIEQGFADAGSVPDSVEVSIDRTPTGLDVDSIQGAGRAGETCIVGEVREGTVSVTLLPALATGLCFVGDQR